MAKYIDAEKLKAEIERLKGQLIRGACAAQIEMETNCKEEAYDEVLSLLDTLEESKGNEVKIGKSVRDFIVEGKEIVVPEPPIDNSPQFNLVVHKEELVCKELEEASIRYEKERPYNQFVSESIKLAYIAGAKWDREQMLKETAEAELCSAGLFIPMISFNDKRVSGIKYGDKIRIIILPKED